MAQQKVSVIQKGDRYLSSHNSLVLHMEETRPEFEKAGFYAKRLDYIPEEAYYFVAKNHPELEEDIRSGRVQVRPTEVVQYNDGNGQRFYEVDYTLERPEEQFDVVRQSESFAMPKNDVRRSGVLRNIADALRVQAHDPLYVFDERRLGSIRRTVLDIIAKMTEDSAVAARLTRGKETARFRQCIRELSSLYNLPESRVEAIIETRARNFKNNLNNTPVTARAGGP